MNTIRFFGADDVFRLLDTGDCIRLTRETLAGLASGQGRQYLRGHVALPNSNLLAFMPAWLDGQYFGAKILSIYHDNQTAGLPSHQGGALLFDSKSGAPVALVDAFALTQVRTGAVSAVATDLLARPDASRLCLLGCGSQAISHLQAIRLVRGLTRVTAWDIDPERAKAFAAAWSAETGLPVAAEPTAWAAIDGADIVCTLTPSRVPILEPDWIAPGTHINAVGACRPDDRELPSMLMARARVFGDARESVLAEAGDFLIPMKEGLFGEEWLLGTIGELALGSVRGRVSADDVTVFEALGLAIEDIAAAKHVYEAGTRG
ncbi:MAG: ornithine cyclodeaminase family protein [Oscillospiraceae bacterium]|jgi:ornithine cyclodeaminase|nr:ornithine cyclodeaminase family protein [Oscillospiraceae bacterium]